MPYRSYPYEKVSPRSDADRSIRSPCLRETTLHHVQQGDEDVLDFEDSTERNREVQHDGRLRLRVHGQARHAWHDEVPLGIGRPRATTVIL